MSWTRQRRPATRSRFLAYRCSTRHFVRLAWTASSLFASVATPRAANAEVYAYVDKEGVLHITNLPDDAIVEAPGIISSFGLRGLSFPPLPEGIAELCRRELALSSLVVDAVIKGDRQLALQALLLDPMMNDIDRARAILDDFLTTFAEYLPQFV